MYFCKLILQSTTLTSRVLSLSSVMKVSGSVLADEISSYLEYGISDLSICPKIKSPFLTLRIELLRILDKVLLEEETWM